MEERRGVDVVGSTTGGVWGMGVRGVVCEVGSVVCMPAEGLEGGERSGSLLTLLRATGVKGFSRSPWGEEELRGISVAPILNYHPLSLILSLSWKSLLSLLVSTHPLSGGKRFSLRE